MIWVSSIVISLQPLPILILFPLIQYVSSLQILSQIGSWPSVSSSRITLPSPPITTLIAFLLEPGKLKVFSKEKLNLFSSSFSLIVISSASLSFPEIHNFFEKFEFITLPIFPEQDVSTSSILHPLFKEHDIISFKYISVPPLM